jgi:ATP-dependent helicase/nuclease subunit B
MRLVNDASFMLEPVAENILVTIGWLELPWCPDDEIVIAGFNEGCVPENIVGHPFIPDSLRKELGISTNEAREARDSFILAQALACREEGSLSIYLHQTSSDKNVMKPSRILFNGIGDDELPGLALRLYAVTKGNEGAPAKELPEAWRLKLPIPPKGTYFRKAISPAKLDGYLRCPFTFYLNEVFGGRSDDRNRELDDFAFGNLCHSALEHFATQGPKDSTNAEEIAAFLSNDVHLQLQAFGMNPPAVIALQGEAAIARLKAFSVRQALRRLDGWRIVSSEQEFKCSIKGCETVLYGRVDRIDEHEETGELEIIDYKTWNRAKDEKYESLQLPIYRAMVEASNKYDPLKARSARALYCVLAERAEDVVFDEKTAQHQGTQSDAEDKVVSLLTGIAKGIFYPPKKDASSSSMVWQREFSSLIPVSPEDYIDPEWIKDQLSRVEAPL